jgi:four helix bundle protein
MTFRVGKFEELVAWQKARSLTRLIYEVSRREPFARDRGLSTQMQRAAVSIMSNIAEGFERHGSAEFQHFLSIAKASCAELRSQLYVALDIGYITEAEFASLQSCAEEVGRILGGLRASVARQRS